MSEKLSCGIARDLMPLVIDDVAGEESKRAVEAHLAECAECSRIYETLKQPDPIPARDEQDRLHFRQSMKRVSRRGMAKESRNYSTSCGANASRPAVSKRVLRRLRCPSCCIPEPPFADASIISHFIR